MSFNGVNILVTGGAGFIGSELTRQLMTAGAQVTVVDNLTNGRRDNVADILGDGCRLCEVDVRDLDQMAILMRKTAIVFHLACLGVRHSIHSPRENHDVNATATLDLLALARKSNVQRFVYVSSSEVYGTARTVPMTEEHPTFPHTVYGATKLAGECYARAYNQTYGFQTVIVRPFNTYGPRCHHEGDSGEVIPKFMLRCMAGQPMIVFGDGTQTRDFTHVRDTARGILMAGVADQVVGQTFNLGSGCEISINDLAREIAFVSGQSTANVCHEISRPGDVLRLCADTTKARQQLGYQPEVSLRQGLDQLKQWYVGLGKSLKLLLEEDVVRNWEVKGGGAEEKV
ncbi:MAG: SDR family NAD(P)-dependent oxidoreductase [Fibrobacterota bacterium]